MATHFPLLCYSSVNVVTLLLYILCSTWSENEANLTRESGLDIESRKYDASWAVQLQYSAKESDVRFIASSLGLDYRQILPNNYYLMTDENSPDPSDEPNLQITESLKSFPTVLWVEQQTLYENDVRESVDPSDPLWKYKQKYLHSNPAGFTINHHVQDVWNQGYTGKNVTVAVIDDGVRGTHHEFEKRYDFDVSYDIAKGYSDSRARHGTKCAGVIAAGDSNGWCGVGVAFDSKIAGIRLFANLSSTDAQEAQAFYNNKTTKKVDIFSNSWGPKDNGHSIRGPGPLATKALEMGTTTGRNGQGSIYLFSAGNGGQFGDSCAFDGYVNNIHTIAVTSVTKDGKLAPHSEACAAIMTAVYSSDMVTLSSESDTGCVDDFGRTSAASAFLSGILALTLEANPNITWRAVQHLIARSSTWNGVNSDVKRVTNGNNFTVGEYFGFGVLDALTLIGKAKQWNGSVPEQLMCTMNIISDGDSRSIPDRITKDVKQEDLNCASKKKIRSLEHVQLRVDLNFTTRAVLAVDVTSPLGTISRFIYSRLWDAITQRKSYSDLVVTSVHFWGEPVVGNWTVDLKEGIESSIQRTGTLFNLTLVFYGTSEVIPGNNNEYIIDPKIPTTPPTPTRYSQSTSTTARSSSTVYVPTEGSLTVTVCSSPIKLYQGDDLECLCKGGNLTWYKDGVQIGTTRITENTLSINDVKMGDRGTYRCVSQYLKDEKSIDVTVTRFRPWVYIVITICIIVVCVPAGYLIYRYLKHKCPHRPSHEDVKLRVGPSATCPVEKVMV